MNYLLPCANMHTYTLQHTYCAHSVPLMLYVLPAVSMHLLALKYAVMLFMLFHVLCSALVLTDCQSNALTPSICSTVTSLMDVSYTCGCKRWMILVMLLTRHILNLPLQFKIRCSMVQSPTKPVVVMLTPCACVCYRCNCLAVKPNCGESHTLAQL